MVVEDKTPFPPHFPPRTTQISLFTLPRDLTLPHDAAILCLLKPLGDAQHLLGSTWGTSRRAQATCCLPFREAQWTKSCLYFIQKSFPECPIPDVSPRASTCWHRPALAPLVGTVCMHTMATTANTGTLTEPFLWLQEPALQRTSCWLPSLPCHSPSAI